MWFIDVHQSVTPFLSGAPPLKRDPGSAPVFGLEMRSVFEPKPYFFCTMPSDMTLYSDTAFFHMRQDKRQ